MIFSCHNLKELVFFDGVKLMILNNLQHFVSLFLARAYALAEGGGARTFRPLQSSSLSPSMKKMILRL